MTMCYFDVETTGLHKPGKSLTDPSQPHVMQLGAVLVSRNWEEVSSMQVLIKPEGWTSETGATNVHNISMRQCELYGVRIHAALAMFIDMVRAATELLAYALPFDTRLIDIELARLGANPIEWKRGGLTRTCVMQECGQRFNNGKAMKLTAAYKRATGKEFDQLHRGLSDARAAVEIMRAIRDDFDN